MPEVPAMIAPPWPATAVEEAFAPSLAAAGQARAFLRETVARWTLPKTLVDDATLVLSEAVANAARHAGTPLVVSVAVDGRSLLLSVTDGDVTSPHVASQRDWFGEHGRGMLIIQALASESGVEQTAIGKRVWARLAIPTGQEPR